MCNHNHGGADEGNAVRIESGNQVITITIQIAPAGSGGCGCGGGCGGHQHGHHHGHQHGKKGGCGCQDQQEEVEPHLDRDNMTPEQRAYYAQEGDENGMLPHAYHHPPGHPLHDLSRKMHPGPPQ